MKRDQISLLDVHCVLSALSFAVKETLSPLWVDVKVQWREGTYLSVEVECRARNKQEVIDRLAHGALVGKYDYRFRLSYPTMPTEPDDWLTVTAYPDMHHDDRKAAA